MLRWASTAVLLVFLGCGLVPERVDPSDPRVTELLNARSRVDTASLGFSEIGPTTEIRLEGKGRGYDAMLHIVGATSRTVSFRKTKAGYEWVGEQETITGPKEYDSPDGRLREKIFITFETVEVSGVSPGRTHVEYWGDDPSISHMAGELPMDVARPIIQKWQQAESVAPKPRPN